MLLKFNSYGFILSALIISSCATTSGSLKRQSRQNNVVDLKEVKDIPQEETKVVSSRPVEIPEEIITPPKEVPLEPKKDFQLSYKPEHYKFWKKYFSKTENARFKRFLKNGSRFKKVVDQVFKEHGLPVELFYVGLIESGYNTHIKSRASAVGPWQFIKGTAKRYGMRVDSYVDERRNIHKASAAAAGYFKDLYNIFGSWELALCAYNAGEYRIINAIRKGNTRDYLELVEKKLIPKETIFYIPKIAAARDIAETMTHHLTGHEKATLYKDSQVIRLSRNFSAEQVRKKLKISRSDFKLLNPDLKRDWIRRGKGFRLVIPKAVDKGRIAQIKTLKAKEPAYVKRRIASRKNKQVTHKVRKGQSLSSIAKKYGLSVSSLKSLNSLRSNKIFPGQKLKVSSAKTTVYTVKKGDYLGKIASRFNTSVSNLKRWNGLRSTRLKVGQKLKVLKDKLLKKLYVVRRGDNLYRIAKRFGVTVSSLMKVNSLARKVIYPSQKIIIPSKS